MVNRLLFFIGILCLFAAYPANALNLPQQQRFVMRRAIDCIIDCRFDEALAIADSLTAHDGQDPTGPFLSLFTLGMRDLDYGTVTEPDRFLRAYKKVNQVLDSVEQNQGKTSFTLTIRGFAQSAYSSFYLRQKQYFGAVQSGLDALKNLENAQKNDTLNHDVDFFFGLYIFAKSELKKRLWWVMFWYNEDKRAGIVRLENCAQSAQFAGSAARMSLADIYIREKEFAKAAKLLSALRLEYPLSRFILWSQVKYCEEIADNKQAAPLCENLIALYKPIPEAGQSMLQARNRLAWALHRLKKNDEAMAQCTIIMESIDKKNRSVYRDLIDDTQKIINELRKKN